MYLKLECPNCGTDIPAGAINIDKLIAKCENCNHIFTFEKKLTEAPRQRPEVFMPKGIEAYSLINELFIEVSWREGLNCFMTIFTLLWNSIVSIFVISAILTGSYEMLLFTSVHVLVGVGLIYYLLTMMFNTTFISVDNYHLTIVHKPLWVPFYPNRHIPVFDIEQIYIEKYVASKTNGNPNYAFSVSAILKNKKQVKLIKGLPVSTQARYIEQEIERFLKIDDRPIEEEWKG